MNIEVASSAALSFSIALAFGSVEITSSILSHIGRS